MAPKGGDRHLLSPQCKLKRSIFCHKTWVLAFPLSFPSTKVHISHEETSSRTRPASCILFWGRIAQVSLCFCKKLTSVKVCYELWTIFCALHILIKSECGCKSSRQSEVTQSGVHGGTPCESIYSGCATSFVWDGPFSRAMLVLGRVRVPKSQAPQFLLS